MWGNFNCARCGLYKHLLFNSTTTITTIRIHHHHLFSLIIMAIIDQLPYDILVEIFSGLSMSDLANTSRISLYFQAICEPLLYRAPRVLVNSHTPKSLEKFLRSLLLDGRPHLLYHVSTLTLRWSHRITPSRLAPDMEALASHLGLDQYSPSPQDTQLLVLLHALRLTVLDISPPQVCSAFNRFMRTHDSSILSTLPRGLQFLREFRCIRGTNGSGVTPTTIRALMTLPSMRKIDVAFMENTDPKSPYIEHISSVTDLKLSYVTIVKPWSLHCILWMPHSLERFSLSVAPQYGYFSAPGLGKALTPIENSLKYLRLDFYNFINMQSNDESDDDDEVTDTIGSLRKWPLLETVVISLIPLLGYEVGPRMPRLVDILPANLCNLEILRDCFWWHDDVEDQILKMLEDKQTMLPRLQKVGVFTTTVMNPARRERLEVACNAVGVTLVDDTSDW